MKKKRLMALILAASLAMGLSACKGSKEAGEVKGDTAAEKPYTVTMVIGGTEQADEARIEEKINQILEKELNARLDLMVLPWGSRDQQVQLMLSGDEKIDCLYTGTSTASQYMRSGQLVDLTELIDQYGKNVKEIFGEEVLRNNAINGFVFGIPTQIERGSIPAIYMRKDLVEKYNIDVDAINSPSDMEEVFAAVKAGEPDMTMLYSSSNDDPPLNRLIGGGIDFLGDDDMIGVLMNSAENTTIENLYASDWYMENASMLYDWFGKGYISKDAGTDTENWRSVFKSGKLFSMFFTYHPLTPIEFATSTGYEFEIVTFGDRAVKKSNAYANTNFSIAQNSENPEVTMQVLDYIYGSSEIMNLLNWGEESVDYEIVNKEEDMIDYPDGVTADTVGYSLNLGWELPNQFITHVWNGSEPGSWEKLTKFNDEAMDSLAMGFIFDSSGYENEIAALSNVVAKYKGSLNSGSVDPKEYIPKFLEELETAGIDTIIEAKQEQLDKFLEQ